jgi:nitrous oxidase accessory protein
VGGTVQPNELSLKKLLTIPILFCCSLLFARQIIVGNNQPVKSIKQAINLAHDGDTILVDQGVYKEGALTLTKSVTIIGREGATLDGENKFQILAITGKNITVKNLLFKNAGYSATNDYAAIKIVDAENIRIENNTIINSYFAIHISNTYHPQILHNNIAGTPKSEQLTGNAIHLWKCNYALIAGNHVQGHRDGIYFEFVTHSLVQDNLSENNIRYGIHFMFSNDDTYFGNTFKKNGAGVAVMYSKKVTMMWNHFQENWGGSAYGILLKDISDSRIRRNIFYKNTVALHLEGTSRIEIEQNTFSQNGWAIKVQASCEDNNFHNNNFFGNSFDVATNGTMVLNKFYNNYWDKYEGYDLNKDGIGDVPYHPVSLYASIIEENPNALLLMRSFMVNLLDKAEKAIPSLTPENLIDDKPMIKPNKL